MLLVRSLLLVSAKYPVLSQVVQSAAAGVLGLGMIVSIIEHAGGTTGEAVVHVAESDVDVIIGGQRYRVEDRTYPPIVCELSAGRHRLVMTRGEDVLYNEPFSVERGRSVVLTAWDTGKQSDKPSPRPSWRRLGSIDPSP